MSLTIQEMLDMSNGTTLAPALAQLRDDDDEGFGAILAGLIPRKIERSGLTNGTEHIEPEAGAILIVTDAAGTTAYTMVHGAAGAGEVTVEYDSEGVATLTFNGAVTEYTVTKQVLPAGLGTALAAVGS